MTTDNTEYPDPTSFPEPEDFVPDEDFEDEHGKDSTGGPGGIVNYDESLRPEGWVYEPGVSSPKVVDTNVEEA